MAKAPKKKQARDLTSDETMDRLFGREAAKKLREVLDDEDARKGKRTKKKASE